MHHQAQLGFYEVTIDFFSMMTFVISPASVFRTLDRDSNPFSTITGCKEINEDLSNC